MKYASLPGVERPLARLVMGGMSTPTVGGQIVLDDYFERGGNVVDTAFIYGEADESIGHWLRTRGVRDDVSLIVKGAHTPHCTPEALTEQLEISLDRLGTDHGEIYIMHRDNPDVPVGEFIDVLNEPPTGGPHRRLRRLELEHRTTVRSERVCRRARPRGILAAQQPAESRGGRRAGLGRMPERQRCGLATLARREPLPAARVVESGARVLHAASRPGRLSDAELVRCWYSDANFERKRRAAELAAGEGLRRDQHRARVGA